MEFITFVGQVAFWYFVINLLLSPLKRKIVAQQESEMSDILQKFNDIVHRVHVEQHGEMFYWFDADNDSFLGQGKTVEETIEHVKKRFPQHIFFVATKDQQYKIAGPEWSLVPFKINESSNNTQSTN